MSFYEDDDSKILAAWALHPRHERTAQKLTGPLAIMSESKSELHREGGSSLYSLATFANICHLYFKSLNGWVALFF